MRCHLFFTVALLSGAQICAGAVAEVGYDTAFYYYADQLYRHVDQQTAVDKVYITTSLPVGGPVGVTGGVSGASGYADASRLAVGVRTWIQSLSEGYGGQAVASAYMANTFKVTPNPSLDLYAGDTVRLAWSPTLNGSLFVSSGGNAQGEVAMAIVEGGSVPKPQGDGAVLDYLHSFTAAWHSAQGSEGLTTSLGWQVDKIHATDGDHYGLNGAGSYYGLAQNYPGNPDVFYSLTRSGTDANDYPLPFDAALNATPTPRYFDAVVGETYSLFAYMSMDYTECGWGYVPAVYGSLVDIDFSHTMSSGLTVEDPLVVIEWGVAVVPEPTTLALLVCGAGVMLGRRQRARR